MARGDITPFHSEHGGHNSIRWGEMTASEVFEGGEPIMVVDAGTLTEPTDNAAQWVVSEFSATGTSALSGGIAVFGPGAGNIDPETGLAFATGGAVAFYPINEGNLFFTGNFYAAGGGSVLAPVLTDMGEAYQLVYGTFGTPDAGWGIEQTSAVAGTDVQARIVDILDSTLRPIRSSGNAGVGVVFEINART